MAYDDNVPDLTALAMAAYEAILRDTEAGFFEKVEKSPPHGPEKQSGQAGSPKELPRYRFVVL